MKLEEEIKTAKFGNIYQKAILNLIFTGGWVTAKIDTLLKPYGISSQQYNVLRILRGQQDKAINLFEIQERMLNKMSNSTRLVEKLRLKELVTRVQCEHNRRKVDIAITKKGLALLKEIDPLMVKLNNAIVGKITEEQAEQLSSLLDSLRE